MKGNKAIVSVYQEKCKTLDFLAETYINSDSTEKRYVKTINAMMNFELGAVRTLEFVLDICDKHKYNYEHKETR